MDVNNSSVFNEPLGGRWRSSDAAKRKQMYVTSFKQMSGMQQKQAGLIVGAAVADAALHRISLMDGPEGLAAAIAAHDDYETSVLRRQTPDACYTSYHPTTRPNGFSLLDPCVFAAAGPHKTATSLPVDGAEDGWLSTAADAHSYSYLFLATYVRVLAEERHAVAFDRIGHALADLAARYPAAQAAEHGRLDHICAALVPALAMNPWAADEDVRAYVQPFVAALTNATADDPIPHLDPTIEANVGSFLGIPLRCLQHNPNPVRNAAFNASPYSAALFPPSEQPHVPMLGPSHHAALPLPAGSTPSDHGGPSAAVGVSEAVAEQRHVVQTAAAIVARARNYAEGVLLSSRAPLVPLVAGCARTVPCARVGVLGMLVGASLGARFGVRSIAPEWLSATSGHEPLCSHAIDIAQWAWNNPSRLRQ